MTMKKGLALLLTLLLACSTACGEGFVYSTQSVCDNAQTSPLYDVFYQSGELGVSIPGVAEGIVPQGIAYLPEEDWVLFSGYRGDGGSSALIAGLRQRARHTSDGYPGAPPAVFANCRGIAP